MQDLAPEDAPLFLLSSPSATNVLPKAMSNSPFSFEEDRFDEVFRAISQGTSAKLQETQAQLVLVSRQSEPKGLKSQIRKLQNIVRALYGTRALVVGGGYGCHRFIIHIVGKEDDIRKTIAAIKGGDPAITSVLGQARFDFVEDLKNGERVNFETPEEVESPDDIIDRILKKVPALKEKLQNKFINRRDQARNLADFLTCLQKLLEALASRVIGDVSDIPKFKHLGDVLVNAIPEVYTIVEELVGSVDAIKAARLS